MKRLKRNISSDPSSKVLRSKNITGIKKKILKRRAKQPSVIKEEQVNDKHSEKISNKKVKKMVKIKTEERDANIQVNNVP